MVRLLEEIFGHYLQQAIGPAVLIAGIFVALSIWFLHHAVRQFRLNAVQFAILTIVGLALGLAGVLGAQTLRQAVTGFVVGAVVYASYCFAAVRATATKPARGEDSTTDQDR